MRIAGNVGNSNSTGSELILQGYVLFTMSQLLSLINSNMFTLPVQTRSEGVPLTISAVKIIGVIMDFLNFLPSFELPDIFFRACLLNFLLFSKNTQRFFHEYSAWFT